MNLLIDGEYLATWKLVKDGIEFLVWFGLYLAALLLDITDDEFFVVALREI